MKMNKKIALKQQKFMKFTSHNTIKNYSPIKASKNPRKQKKLTIILQFIFIFCRFYCHEASNNNKKAKKNYKNKKIQPFFVHHAEILLGI